MNKNSKILVVGHDDVIERSLHRHFSNLGYGKVFSSTQMGMNPTIQPSVYDFFTKEKPEYVFLASTRSGGIQVNLAHPAEFIYHNLESQSNIIYAAHKFGVKKLMYFSSSCVYPKDALQPMKEEYLLTGALEKSSEPYAVSKIAGIKLCESFKKEYGLNTVVMIPATIYGPDCDVDLATAHVMGALIEKFSKAVQENLPEVVVWGGGNARREFIYVDDFVQAALFLMEHYDDGQMINAGPGIEIMIKDLAETIARVVGFRGKIIFDASKPEGAMRKLLDSSRLKNLGWRPKVNLEEGISKTFQWYSGRKQAQPAS
jgi:GDP-L-fucose synthase